MLLFSSVECMILWLNISVMVYFDCHVPYFSKKDLDVLVKYQRRLKNKLKKNGFRCPHTFIMPKYYEFCMNNKVSEKRYIWLYSSRKYSGEKIPKKYTLFYFNQKNMHFAWTTMSVFISLVNNIGLKSTCKYF